jgi:hypothetical protein
MIEKMQSNTSGKQIAHHLLRPPHKTLAENISNEMLFSIFIQVAFFLENHLNMEHVCQVKWAFSTFHIYFIFALQTMKKLLSFLLPLFALFYIGIFVAMFLLCWNFTEIEPVEKVIISTQ